MSASGNININSHQNQNPDPDVSIYPRLSDQDAPYSIEETLLRSVIFIPAGFKFGQDGKTPVILVPGTGSYGGENYGQNLAKLLAASSFGDPVWLNVPGRMCNDASKNAEYAAYAINYIATRCRKKVATVGWSQGNISIQWSLKYWPSTRDQVSNFIALSADFRGSVMARVLVPFKATQPAAPAVWNQTPHSNFIAALRSNGGDSAYVPTTSIYSAVDEAVQPQYGAGASALMKDERNVGVTNCQLLGTPSLWKPAGQGYSHDGVLLSPVTWALTEDAIKNGGPGRIDRIDMSTVSWRRKTSGLSLCDASRTRTVSLRCLMHILTFTPKLWDEPALPLYATAEKNVAVAAAEEDIVVPPNESVGVLKLKSKL
ncbi:hypothetical protein DV737_g2203, partial [Chaetothyriales sp. CBS 132003]